MSTESLEVLWGCLRELIGGEIGYQGEPPGGKFGILIGLFLDLDVFAKIIVI